MKNLFWTIILLIYSLGGMFAQHSISGQIQCLDGFPMTGQEVQLSGDQIGTLTIDTDADGMYIFPDLPAGGNYTLTIEKTNNPLNGVTTYDLVLLMQHILNIQSLPTPFHFLIADVNASDSISTLDLVLIRKVILAISNSFPSGLSWHFATEDYNYNPPMGSVGVVQLDNLQNDEIINFVAVKIGDTSGGMCN